MARLTKSLFVGNVQIGGGAPVSVQSMTNTKTEDVTATLAQIDRLVQAGCQIVRLAIPNTNAVRAFEKIKKVTTVPLVADIHFKHTLALDAIDAGADKIRINPGNIGNENNVRLIVEKAKNYNIPIRVGVNSGSIEKEILQEHGGPTVDALVKSAIKNIELCTSFDANDLVLSLKSSDVLKTVQAYRKVSTMTDVPLHVGVTEAGSVRSGTIKSAIGIGILLSEGIGDTIRVSLTGDPVEEVYVGYQILRNLNLAAKGINLISCPTCGRTETDIIPIVEEIEKRLSFLSTPLTVAVMGCIVNGPGEAKEADIGIACGKGAGVLFKKGTIIRKVPENEIADVLVDLVLNWQK